MRSEPADLDSAQVATAIAGGWGIQVDTLEYVPQGGGSHHWAVTDTKGRKHFVTVDDLDHKPWLGHMRDASFDGLRASFETARAIGLDFVVGPVPSVSDELVGRISSRYSIAVFPFLDGISGRFGRYPSADERDEVVSLLIELHQATPKVAAIARHADLGRGAHLGEVSERDALEAALRDRDGRWDGGHFSEPARVLVARHAEQLAGQLRALDGLVAEVGANRNVVITHGEPHPANTIRVGNRLYMIDWDTVGLAPHERDLWMVADGELERYERATGRKVDPAALRLYQLRWALDDVAIFVSLLRSPHSFSTDTEHAFEALVHYMRALDEDRFEVCALPAALPSG